MNLHSMHQQRQLQASNSARPRTFWTICETCGTKYQYYHSMLKKAVCCQNCLKHFIAHVLTEQHVPSGPIQQSAGVWKNAGVFSEIRLLQKFEPGQVWALYSEADKFPNCYAFIEKVDLRNSEVQARWLEGCAEGEVEKRLVEDGTVGCGTFRVSTTRGIMAYTDTKPFSHPVRAIFTGRRNSYEIYPRKDEVWALLKGWDIGWSSDADNHKNYKYEVVQVLSDYTTCTSISVVPLVKIKVSVNLFMQSKEATPYLIPHDDTIWFSHCVPYHLMSGTESEGIPEGALELDPAALPLNFEEALACVVPESRSVKRSKFDAKCAGSPRGNKSQKGSMGVEERQHATCMDAGIFRKTPTVENRQCNTPLPVEGTDADEESDHIVQEVLCPEFCNFDQLRDVTQFRANQIWAVYDSQGSMPRSYARITKVKRAPKFMVHFVRLEFDPTNKAEVARSCGKLPVACGQFKRGKSETAKETYMFSHTISCEKGKTGNFYEIYPMKGEVWALFKGWDIDWSSDSVKHTDLEYEVVQVISDFTTGTSIIVTPLVKIKGFVSLFMMQCKEASPNLIPRDNTLRFSHCVPHHLMCGTEREGIPEGALELDPAALPSNLEEAFASVSPESSSVKGQEFGAKYTGNNSCKGSVRVGEGQHATCISEGIFPKTTKEENSEHNTPFAVEGTDVEEESEDIVLAEYECPDSEFYDFSEIRSLCKFEPGQIWAIYSDINKFPNYYAFVKNVDLKNNKVQVRWLDVCPRTEEVKRLVKEDWPVGCGTFRVSVVHGLMTYTGTESFSHPVLARSTGRKNEYEILPRLHEIWAVYKNWSAGWTKQDFENCGYELVEIFDQTDSSIQVQLLRKVDGFIAVFRGEEAVKTIRKDEYLKFSHRIPCFHLTNDREGKLRGCLELDPYSVPEEFLGSDSTAR